MTRFSLLMAALVTLLSLPAQAQAQSPDRDWKTLCKSNSCTLSRKLRATEEQSIVTTFFVVVERSSDTVRLGSIIPLGIAVAPGIRFDASGQIYEVPVEVCYPDGCRAQREFTQAESDAITSGQELQIQFIPYGKPAPIFVRMPMDGLAAAIRNAQESFK